jgi:NAD(P)-dependent dehydrogenase (short-subunit alcohol dehydrogenase family)
LAHLTGKVAIVTGGGRGLGRAHAIALANKGAAVLVNDLGGDLSGDGSPSRSPAEEVASAILAAGGQAATDTSDISDWDGARAVVDAAVKAFGRLDILVNNAGIARFGSIDALTRKDWERTIAVNLTGTAAMCHWAAAHWRERGPQSGRSIINTSSAVGLTPPPGNPPYVAAKAGVAALTIACAIELAELGVRVNAIAPVARSRISQVVAPDQMKPVDNGFDRMAPENVAPLVVYLASPLCRFTGRIFGIVADDLTIFDGWTTTLHINNNEQRWTPEALQQALSDVPLQHRGMTQALNGSTEHLTPPNTVLYALSTVEHGQTR